MLQLTHPDALGRARDAILRLSTTLLANTPPSTGVVQYLLGEHTLSNVYRLPAETLLARFVNRAPSATTGEWDSEVGTGKPRLVGSVLDGDSVAYVIIKRAVGGKREDSTKTIDSWVDVMTLKCLSSGSWASMLDGGLFFSQGGFAITVQPGLFR